jgi:diguanylate cyclase (GGDEF)-like protein/PAS domain S-box-containing protein
MFRQTKLKFHAPMNPPRSDHIKEFKPRSPLRLVLLYALFAVLWILTSDYLLFHLFKDPTLLAQVRLAKGFLFAVATSALLYLLLRRWYKALLNALSQSNQALKELKWKGQELAHILKLNQQLLDNSPALIYILDNEGRFVLANKRYLEFFKIGHDQLIGQNRTIIFPQEVAVQERSNDLEIIRTKRAISFEERHIGPNGLHFYISEKFPLLDETNTVIGVCVISTDITDRKRTEQALQEKDAILSESQRIAHIGSWSIDIATKHTIWSDELYRIFGVAPESFDPSREIFFNLIHPDDVAAAKQMIIDLQSGEIIPGLDFRIVRGKGEIGVVRCTGELQYDAAHQPLRIVGSIQDITNLKEIEDRMNYLAYHDLLTDLPNRLLMNSRIEHAITIAKRDKKKLALLVIDLDHFKDVNDSYGHTIGDELLKQVAVRLSSLLRSADTLTRLGGDEFTLLLEGVTQGEDVARVAIDIIEALSKSWRLSNGVDARISASIGISLFPEHGDNASELFQHADAALYQAKAGGRGQYKYFTEELTRNARERFQIERDLRDAIDQGDLRVHYQAQVDIASGRIVGAEALVRWQHKQMGLIPPMKFIPIAEGSGLIDLIGEFVLRETCRQGKCWLDAGYQHLTLSVNLSPRQIQRGDICSLVFSILAETKFPALSLELELTESALMEGENEAIDVLNRLRTIGVRLALDDFGTGYSSLAHLKRLPLDVLKIDKSFVDDIPFHQDDMEIAATIISMGHILGFKVVAEGVETLEQLTFLREKGCDMYQGYFKSKPLPPEEFEQLLKNSGEKQVSAPPKIFSPQ